LSYGFGEDLIGGLRMAGSAEFHYLQLIPIEATNGPDRPEQIRMLSYDLGPDGE